MTPPSKDIPMEDIERRVEIERLKFFIVPEPSHGWAWHAVKIVHESAEMAYGTGRLRAEPF